MRIFWANSNPRFVASIRAHRQYNQRTRFAIPARFAFAAIIFLTSEVLTGSPFSVVKTSLFGFLLIFRLMSSISLRTIGRTKSTVEGSD